MAQKEGMTMAKKPGTNAMQEAINRKKAPPAPPPSQSAEAPARAPTRVGKRNLSAYIDPDVAKAIRLMAVEEDTTVQELLEEAARDFLRKKGRVVQG